jgi:flagellar FliL protein
MAKDDETDETPQQQRPKRPLLLGFFLALAGAGGGYYAIEAGLIRLDAVTTNAARPGAPAGPATAGKGTADVAFVPVEPLVISLDDGGGTHLRFRAQLEVTPGREGEVKHLMPRIVDVLNGYLRAVDVDDLRDNASLVKLRAQMLRRVQVVAGRDRVGDLLIMEFVMN